MAPITLSWSIGLTLVAFVATEGTSSVDTTEDIQIAIQKIIAESNRDLVQRVDALEEEMKGMKKKEAEMERTIKHLQEELLASRNDPNLAYDSNNTGLTNRELEHGLGQQSRHVLHDEYHKRTPNQRAIREGNVAFSAYLNHEVTHMSPGYVLKYNAIILNEGNAYNTHTGVFTVPITGTYVFHFYIEHYHDGRRTDVRLLLDGSNVVSAVVSPYSQAGHDGSAMGGNSAVIHASEGQAVWIETFIDSDGTVYGSAGSRYTTFCGYLLY